MTNEPQSGVLPLNYSRRVPLLIVASIQIKVGLLQASETLQKWSILPELTPISGPSPHLTPASQKDRWRVGAWLFRDDTLRALEVLLDEAFRIPGTPIRFGLDAIIGLVPGLGDVVAGVLSLVIPLAAWIRGVPYVTLVRMTANLGIGVLVGAIPLLGDAFDVAWKPNLRNYRLLQRHLGEPRRHNGRDWLFLALLAGCLAVVFAVPIVLALLLIHWLFQR